MRRLEATTTGNSTKFFMNNISDYDYELPAELIADRPTPRRDDSRLLVIDRQSGEIKHRRITDLPELLSPGDTLVLNDTKVIPARLYGRRAATGGRWEGLFLGTTPQGDWRLIGQTRGRLQAGEQIVITPAHDANSGDELSLTLIEREAEDGIWIARPEQQGDPLPLLARFGTVPLPPYMHRKLATEADWSRYQTVYARQPGAVAAPTAGLHLTPELLAEMQTNDIRQAFVTLHVGIGTFRPIAVEALSEHHMHSEWCELSQPAAQSLVQSRAEGGRIVAVGTTSVRVLESAAKNSDLCAWQGDTNLFIRPPYEFRAIDCLLTNFHLPRSTLLVLVSAFAGADLIRRAYAEAVRERYRFFSYGDAMLIL
jgi:S-adenosylmethionine:tRNA ribosyltransferase-isomerase